MFPDAPIYTLFYDKNATKNVFGDRDIRTSFLQKIPFLSKYHRLFPLLMPVAIEQFDFSSFDVVISISASFAKGIITKPRTRHICLCLTPPRFLWDNSHKFVEEFGYPKFIKKFFPPFISYLRIWDKEAAYRVDEFWAISGFVKDRIKKYYSKNSDIIYPPVDVSNFYISNEIRNYFLMVGRLVAYKCFDLGIKSFNKLKIPLKVVGSGPEMERLKKLAGTNIEFLGSVSDNELSEFYSKAQALVFPQEEDFGIVPLEAMASGRPVIAFKGGGAQETILEGETGLFFDKQEVDSVVKIVKSFQQRNFNPAICRSQAEKFNIEIFKKKVLDKLNN